MNKNATKSRGPGRPMYQPVIPKGKFTMADFCEANGVDVKTGKGKNCSKLTLIKFMGRKQGKAMIRKVKGELAAPANKNGLGRKSFLYERIPGTVATKSTKAVKAAKSTKAPKAAKSTASDYEATKAALLAPTPAVVITPEATPEPEVAETATAEVNDTATVATAEPVAS